MPVYWPNGSLTAPRATSEFNAARRNPVTGVVQPHNGIDLVGWADVLSPVDGTVLFAGYNGGAGNEVRIRADGPTAFHVGDVFRLMHHAALYVRSGQRVSARQPVGRMGTTGNSTGVHCHYETHEFRLGNPINPRDFMARANSNPASGGGGIEIIMDKETFIAWMWEFFKFRSRDGGPDGSGEGHKKGATAWERLNNVIGKLDELLGITNLDEYSKGSTGWPRFRNALTRWYIYHSRVADDQPTLPEQLAAIRSQLDKAPGNTVTVKLDAAMLASALTDPKVVAAFVGPIAKAVNDDAANRMRS